jgi:hypothetical protein
MKAGPKTWAGCWLNSFLPFCFVDARDVVRRDLVFLRNEGSFETHAASDHRRKKHPFVPSPRSQRPHAVGCLADSPQHGSHAAAQTPHVRYRVAVRSTAGRYCGKVLTLPGSGATVAAVFIFFCTCLLKDSGSTLKLSRLWTSVVALRLLWKPCDHLVCQIEQYAERKPTRPGGLPQ